ncbi:MAG: carboxypeptidase M32 [Bdellovibrionota bacterium]
MNTTDKYNSFLDAVRTRKHLSATLSLLNWDEQVNLPEGASSGRAEQISALAKILHEQNTDARYVALIDELMAADLSPDARVNVSEIHRDVSRALKIPTALVAATAKAESETFSRWVEARQSGSFAAVLPQLTTLFGLKQELAGILKGTGTAYDAMLDLYEPGLTANETTTFFSALQPALTELLQRVTASSPAPKNPARGSFPKALQQSFCQHVAEKMGFDFRRGRLDVAVHPFCTELGFNDVRLTTRYFEDDFAPSLYGTMHEAGHGLYDLGYDPAHAHTPLAEYCSMAIHESQSRLWENIVGRSRGFLGFLFPTLQQTFPDSLAGVSCEDVYRYVTRVEPSFIRVEADEVSYGLHIIIRFELERDLFSGALQLADVSAAWNEKYTKYLGITPPDDLHGVLQDVHWYSGGFGYFPTYLLGSAYAAQLFTALKKDRPAVNEEIAQGELLGIKEWLNERVHRQGKRYKAKELIRVATGELPNPRYFVEYLEEKYAPKA